MPPFEHGDPPPKEIPPDIFSYANGNLRYAVWLVKVDTLCQRFVNYDLMSLIEDPRNGFDVWDAWRTGVSPEQFFNEVVLSHIEYEHGCEFLDVLIGVEAMWGAKAP